MKKAEVSEELRSWKKEGKEGGMYKERKKEYKKLWRKRKGKGKNGKGR